MIVEVAVELVEVLQAAVVVVVEEEAEAVEVVDGARGSSAAHLSLQREIR